MLSLNTYSYVVEFYRRETMSATYSGCIRPVGVHMDCRVENDFMETLPYIVKCKYEGPKKQRIPSIGEFKSLSRCSNCNRKGHNSRTCRVNKLIKSCNHSF